MENNFGQFSILTTDKIEKITLKEMLDKADILKDDRIYELFQDDLKEFVNRYVDNEYIPFLRVLSDCMLLTIPVSIHHNVLGLIRNIVHF